MVLGSLGTVLAYSLVAEDKTAEGLNAAQSRIQGISKAAGIGGAAMTGIGAAMLVASEEVNSAYHDIQIGTGATGEALNELRGSFDNIYGSIPAGADAVGGAIANLNTYTGATGETLEDLTTKVLNVSRMMGEEGVGNAAAYGQMLNQWGLSAEEGANKMDGMFAVCQKTGLGFGELVTELNKYGPVLQNAGYSTEEAADLFGQLNTAGIDVSRVMPGLNKSFRTWADEGKNGQEELAKVVDEMKNAETSADALNIATNTFGAEGAQRLLTAVNQGAFELEALGVVSGETSGLINQTADETLLLSDKLGMMKDNAMATLAPFEGLGTALTVVGPGMMALSQIGPAIAAVKGMGLAMKGLSLSMLAPPMGVVIAVVGIVVALALLEQKFGIISKAAALVSEAFGKLVSWLKETFMTTVEKVRDIIGAVSDKAVLLLGPIGLVYYAFEHWQEILELVTGAFGSIIEYITGLYSKFKEMGENLVKYLIEGVKKKINDLKNLISGALKDVRDLFPFSPAKTGPLAVLPDWESYITAPMKKVSISPDMIFEKAFVPGAVASAGSASGGPASGGASTINYNTITISGNYIKDDYDVERIADTMMRKLDNLR